jgi:hypothetical protein
LVDDRHDPEVSTNYSTSKNKINDIPKPKG